LPLQLSDELVHATFIMTRGIAVTSGFARGGEIEESRPIRGALDGDMHGQGALAQPALREAKVIAFICRSSCGDFGEPKVAMVNE
jgi:hypothetical protein